MDIAGLCIAMRDNSPLACYLEICRHAAMPHFAPQLPAWLRCPEFKAHICRGDAHLHCTDLT